MIRNRSATLAWKDGFEMGFQKGYATARADIFTTTLRMKRKPYKNAPPEIK